MKDTYFLKGKNIYLRPILFKDVNEEYIKWLNDSEVNKYSGRRFMPTSEFEAKNYLSSLKSDEAVLAICSNSGKHIGNIKYGPISWIHKSAEISIVIGDKSEWGKGYASEAIYLVTKHLFNTCGLNTVHAGTYNPAFVSAVVKKLGWTQEGILRETHFLDNKFIDSIKLAILSKEFKILSQYELEE